jgi:MerR family copper efflux transcriptional regulator
MRIGQPAETSGVPSSNIRFYEQKSLLPLTRRLPSGYRHYDKQAVDRLQLIKFSQSLGFALDELPILVDKQCEWDHQLILERLIQKQQQVDGLLKQLKQKKQKLSALVAQLQQHWQSGECLPQEKLSALLNDSQY